MRIAWLIVAVALIVAGVFQHQSRQIAACEKETHALRAALTTALNRPPPPAPGAVPAPTARRSAPVLRREDSVTFVPDLMNRFQRYANKLYFAQKFENWPLINFYLEEIEETAKEFARENVMHGQVNISGLMGALIVTEIEDDVEVTASKKDPTAFRKSYHTLMANCNGCHVAVNVPIVITDPQTPVFDNQRYAPPAPAGAASAITNAAPTVASSVPSEQH